MFNTKVTLSDLPGRTHMAELQISTHEHMAEFQIFFWIIGNLLGLQRLNWRLNDQ